MGDHHNHVLPAVAVWHKPMKSEVDTVTEAVLVINLSEESRNVTLTYSRVEPQLGDSVTATDVWTGRIVEMGLKATVFDLAPHASRFLVLHAAGIEEHIRDFV